MVCDKISQISIVALSSPTFLILILSLKSKVLHEIFYRIKLRIELNNFKMLVTLGPGLV